MRLARAALRSLVAVLITATILTAGQAGARADRAPGTYTVRPGDTLSAVATRTRVRVADLAAANKIIDVHRIRVGDRLVIPGGAPQPPGDAAKPDLRRLPARLRDQPGRLAMLPRFDAAAREFGVPADLLKAVTWQESGWQNDKISSTKALGIGQLMPNTVVFVNGSLLGGARLDPRQPEHNIRMSARFLAYLLQRTKGDARTAVSAYYQGLASVQRRGPYSDTRRYADDVLALQSKF